MSQCDDDVARFLPHLHIAVRLGSLFHAIALIDDGFVLPRFDLTSNLAVLSFAFIVILLMTLQVGSPMASVWAAQLGYTVHEDALGLRPLLVALHTYDNISLLVPFLDVPKGLGSPFQRIASIYDRL